MPRITMHARRVWIVAIALAQACGGDSAGAGETDGGDSTEGGAETTSDAESSGGPTSESSSGTSTSGSEDGADSTTMGPAPTLADVGLFAPLSNYFELDGAAALRFHFGDGNSRWGASAWPFVGDFDGDGLDTVALLDSRSGVLHLADQNDSDELAPRGTRVTLAGIPESPAAGEGLAQLAVAGDWDGDGRDGVGIFVIDTATFYLREEPSDGAPDHVVTLSEAAGFPPDARPLAGDWDGDGDDEIGLHDGASAFLVDDLDVPTPAVVLALPGGAAVAADFDGDGVDTLATFDPATHTFVIRDANEDDAGTTERVLGEPHPGFWAWQPLAGAWQVPQAPVARTGFDWDEEDPSDHGIDAAALTAALDGAGDVGNVTAIVVVRDGVLVGERYYHGFDRHIAGNIKSASKSVLSALVGVGIDEGLVGSLDDTVANQLPAYFAGQPAGKLVITLEDLMTMRAGLAWNEGGGDLMAMAASPDYTAFVVGRPLASEPGTMFVYSTGSTQVGAAIVTETSGESTQAFARTRLLEPLGISVPRWDLAPEGHRIGGAEMWMRPRDMARFGLLYLRDGTIDGAPILSSGWVAQSLDPWVPEAGGRLYGLWWRERPWTSYPFDDSAFAWGHGGQFVFLFPSWDLVVVVTSKWLVTSEESGTASGAVFALVDGAILPTIAE